VVSYEQLQNITTAVQVAESNLEIARFNFHHSSIYAPSDGRILKQLSEENELISPGMPLFIYGSYDGQWVIKVGTSDKDIIRFHINDRANVQFDAYRNTVFEGHITELAAAANPMNGLFEIEVVINDQGKRLMSGFIGKVTLFPSEKKEIALIPASSLIEAQNMTGQVYVPERDNQTVKKVNVRIEQVLDEHLAIAKGLEDYPYVITDGAAYLQENSQIKIIE
jgi:RND family efflux transporter MFP subunit